MSYQPLHHKYRPQTFTQLVGQDAIATTLSNALQQNRIAPAYLFTGARGTGKTSSARIFAKSLNCIAVNAPTDKPCGVCQTCQEITKGAALDVIEIDAASNTGVDHIRELIERSQFAPVQCRYKVYVIDECLTGDTLIQTHQGLYRIDDPTLVGKQVLSYNDKTGVWEYKKVLRWFDQGVRQTFVIKTKNRTIRCTGNHLIRTNEGWIAASNLKPGMQILSPGSAPKQQSNQKSTQLDHSALAAVASFSSSQAAFSKTQRVCQPIKNIGSSFPTSTITDANSQLPLIKKSWNNSKQFVQIVNAAVVKNWTSLRSQNTLASPISKNIGNNIPQSKTIGLFNPFPIDLLNLNLCDRSAPAAVANDWISQPTFLHGQHQQQLKEYRTTGNAILIEKGTETGILEPKTISKHLRHWMQNAWDSFMELYWEIVRSLIPMPTAAFPGLPLSMQNNKENGWSTKHSDCHNYERKLGQLPTMGMDLDEWRSTAIQPVIHNFKKCLQWLSLDVLERRLLPETGLIESHQKGWLGGTWMMGHSASHNLQPQALGFTLKDSLSKKISFWLNGSMSWDIQPICSTFVDKRSAIHTSTWVQEQPENGYLISEHSQFQQWHTNLEQVESIELGELEPVYDIEVEDNHNFIGNGLTLHNCHMLSAAAFNALLKTLEEPPDRVVFVLATTDPQRVLPTIISRCQRFDFRRIPLDAMVGHLGTIAQKEGILITDEALHLIAQISQGGLRDAESLLDQLSLLSGDITVERVWDLVGAVPERDLMALLEAIAQDNPEGVLDTTRRLMDRGREPIIVLQNLASFYRDLLIAKASPSRGDLVALTPPTWEQLCNFAKQLDFSTILLGQQHLKDSETQLKHTTQPRLWLEVTLMGLLPSAIAAAPASVPVAAPVAPTSAPRPAKPTAPVQSRPQSASVPIEAPKAEIVDRPSTEPSAPASVTEPAIPEPIAPTQPNLEELWKEIINNLQPFGTQALLKQQGSLLSFDGEEAQIGIASAQLLNMAQGRSKNIQAAFLKTFNKEIKFTLVVAPAHATPSTIPASEPFLEVQESEAPSAEKPSPIVPPPEPPNPSPLPTSFEEAPPPEPSPLEMPTYSKQDWQDDEVARAARDLMETFNGSIVDLDAPTDQVSEIDLSASITALTPPEELSEPEEEDDEDVPF